MRLKKSDFSNEEEEDVDDVVVVVVVVVVVDDDKCCICNLFSPPGLSECTDVVIVKRAEYTKCGH